MEEGFEQRIRVAVFAHLDRLRAASANGALHSREINSFSFGGRPTPHPELLDAAHIIPDGQPDGPMLRHGIQEMEGKRLVVPRGRRAQPDRDRLAERYEQFRAAS